MARWIKHVQLNPILPSKTALIIGIVTALAGWILAAEYVAPLKNPVHNLYKITKSKNMIKLGFGPTKILMINTICVE
jgi:hypothetical protein